MPKEVRVRGKRKYTRDTDDARGFDQAKRFQKDEQLQHLRRRRDAGALAAPQASAGVKPPPKPLPALDRLPVEILQEIFLYGTNLRLPFTSRGLYSALTSPGVKLRLLARLCLDRSEYVVDPSSCDSEECEKPNHCYSCKKIPHSSAEDLWYWKLDPRMSEASVTLKDVHTSLLRQSWVTYEILRQEQWRHLSSFVRKGVQRFLKEDAKMAPADVATQLALLDERLRSNFAWGAYSTHFVRQEWYQPDSQDFEWSPIYKSEVDNGAKLSAYLPDARGLNAVAVIMVEHGPHWHARNLPFKQVWAQAFPSLSSLTAIPSKLLHGPWTQGKGHFLTMICYAIYRATERFTLGEYGNIKPDDLHHYADAQDGLHDAISARCIPAIRLLVNKQFGNVHRHERITLRLDNAISPADIQVLPAFDRSTQGWCPASATALTRLDQLAGPWRAVNEPVRNMWYQPLCLLPKIEHLEAQLRFGHMDWRGISMFCWLWQAGKFLMHDGDRLNLNDVPEVRRMLLKVKFEVRDAERRAWIQEMHDRFCW